METPITLTDADRTLLILLKGCPTGATTYNLVDNFDIELETIAKLVTAGLATIRQHEIARYRPHVMITWILITEEGKRALDQEVFDGVPANVA